MKDQIEYVLMKPGEEKQVTDIVTSVFNESVAPLFSEEGIAEFFKFNHPEALAERNLSDNFTIIAKEAGNPLGIIEIRDCHHICMFFVKKQFQSKRTGKNLLQHAIDVCRERNPEVKNLTVNSSPNSVKIYEKLGFDVTDSEQCINGIRFIPMRMDS